MRTQQRIVLMGVVVAAVLLATRRSAAGPPSTLQTVPSVDLARYAGLWYEIARYPNSFQKGCLGTTATYTLREDKTIGVVNSCRNDKDGSVRAVRGKAWSVDKSNARLKVSFFWPFRGDYWIIDLGENYEYAVVASPNRKLLWILGRAPRMDEGVYNGILRRVEAQGFEPSRIIKTPQ
jgi:apolipoprotein D and lipocalin family protein